jgi:hypothetical protein
MRSQRAKCWDARDGFFKCLDAHDIVDSIKDADKAKASCGTQQASFEKECVASWVPPPPPKLPPFPKTVSGANNGQSGGILQKTSRHGT